MILLDLRYFWYLLQKRNSKNSLDLSLGERNTQTTNFTKGDIKSHLSLKV